MVADREDADSADDGMNVAAPYWLDTARHRPRLPVDFMSGDVRVEKRDTHLLASPGALAVIERGRDAAEGVHAGEDITRRDAGEDRGAVLIAEHVENATVGLGDRVVPRVVLERSGAAEGAHVADDESRIESRHHLESEPEPLDHPEGEVLHHDVDVRQQVEHELFAPLVLEIDTERTLPPVLLHVITRPAIPVVREAAAGVARWRHLDLDDFCSELDHQAGHRRTGEYLGEVEHA